MVTSEDTTILEGEQVELQASGANEYYWSPSQSLNQKTVSSVMAAPKITTTYTIQCISGTCKAYSSLNIKVIEDTIAPIAKAKDINVELNNTGTATISPDGVDNNSTDNVSVEDMALDKTNFDCRDIGKNQIVLTVEDPHGNTASDTATVKIEDKIKPRVTSGHTERIIYGEKDCVAILSNYRDEVEASDNCGIDTIIQIPAIGTVISGDTTELILRVKDNSGNTAEVTFNIEVTDTK